MNLKASSYHKRNYISFEVLSLKYESLIRFGFVHFAFRGALRSFCVNKQKLHLYSVLLPGNCPQ